LGNCALIAGIARSDRHALREMPIALNPAPVPTRFFLSTVGHRRDAALPLDIPALPRQTSAMNSFFKRLFLADFWKGMILTFRTQNPKNVYTEQYPLERPMVAERYRGAPRLNMNPETGETLCIACNLCALACPENLIVVGWHRDDATRRKVLTNFTYDTSRCMFCGLCEDACPTDCLELTQDFEMASYSREGAIWDRHRLEEGPTPARYTR
jgi:NADH-quinone oxidoreductase subunit I